MTDQPLAALPAHYLRPGRSHVLIIGGGTMGADVATVFLRAAARVTVWEINAERSAIICEQIRNGLSELGFSLDYLDNLSIVNDENLVPWSDLDLIVECVPENLPLKQQLFAQIAQKVAPRTILASNSSSFPIGEITRGVSVKNHAVNMHFFMPAHLTPLVEVAACADADEDMLANVCALMRQCGMVAVRVRGSQPGFLANRLQHALAREAFALIDAGVACAQDVDAAVRFGFGFRFLAAGPVLQKDLAGLDVHAAAAATMYPTLHNDAQAAACLRERVAQGQLGMKTGRGFYDWPSEAAHSERARYRRVLKAGLDILAAELPSVGDAPVSDTEPLALKKLP